MTYKELYDKANKLLDNNEITLAEWEEMISPLNKKINVKWINVHGYATPGGDPVWCCPECGKGRHVYGVEHNSYGRDIADHQWVACPNCGVRMNGESFSF